MVPAPTTATGHFAVELSAIMSSSVSFLRQRLRPSAGSPQHSARATISQAGAQRPSQGLRVGPQSRDEATRAPITEPGMRTRDPKAGNDLVLMIENRHGHAASPHEVLLKANCPALGAYL